MKKLAQVSLAFCSATVIAQPYAPNGLLPSDSRIVAWATGVDSLTRGYQNIANPGAGFASFGTASDAIGSPVSNPGTVSLGDGGSITVTFARPLTNGAGADFAVFENGFAFDGGTFAELGHVEVSSNGSHFFRFPSVSLTQTGVQVGAFGAINPRNINNLAGQYSGGEGTPFDLSDLPSNPMLNIFSITHVRVVDVVGSINPLYATKDSLGNVINDPWVTQFASSGFDFNAVGVIHAVPEPISLATVAFGTLLIARRRRK